MKKVLLFEALAVLLLAGIMALLLHQKTAADIPLQEVDAAIQTQYALDGMEQAGEMRMKRAFTLNASDYAEFFYYAPDNTMSVNEILIVKCLDEASVPGVLSAMSSRLETQKKNFDGYGTDQTELLNHALTGSEGVYVWFMVGQDASSWLDTAKKCWEVKK